MQNIVNSSFDIIMMLKVSPVEDTRAQFWNTMEKLILTVVNEERYHIKSSAGQGRYAKNWWTTICDYNFYKNMYGITDRRKVSASIGYYVAYLFNEDNSKVYLCINQASKDITKQKNVKNLEERRKLNSYLLEHIDIPSKCKTSIAGCLTDGRTHSKARDYEEGTFLAIEYDLHNKIQDKVFFDDLQMILEIYSDIIQIVETRKQIRNQEVFDFENRTVYKISKAEEQERLGEKMSVFDFDDYNMYPVAEISSINLKIINERLPEFYLQGTKRKLKRNISLVSHVLKSAGLVCEACGEHNTFYNSLGEVYMEGHHIVPLALQEKYEFGTYNLDNTNNIACVCPECHRALHFGSNDEKKTRIIKLYEKKDIKIDLKERGIANNFDEFLEIILNKT